MRRIYFQKIRKLAVSTALVGILFGCGEKIDPQQDTDNKKNGETEVDSNSDGNTDADSDGVQI